MILESSSNWRQLQFSFAVLTCLGGLILASGTSQESVPMIAIFFAVFGYVCVDWLRLFSLPPVGAYCVMGLASIYCILQFSELHQSGDHQMIAVSRLLVCVQAVLMLQKKTIRIFEQLAVFCLLELVVASVFNDALNYGLLLIPTCLAGLWSLSLLATATSMKSLDQQKTTLPDSWIRVTSTDSVRSISTTGGQLPSLVLIWFGPAVALVAMFFFYGLPRTTRAGQIDNPGSAVVGFSDEVRLEQLGRMGQSTQVAALVRLSGPVDQMPYKPMSAIYLRGGVLENYTASPADRPGKRSSAKWSTASFPLVSTPSSLPPQFYPSSFYRQPDLDQNNADQNIADQNNADQNNADQNGPGGQPAGGNLKRLGDWVAADLVSCQVTYKASRGKTLFSLPPYYQNDDDANVAHCADHWTLSRTGDSLYYPRINYTFGTSAFIDGLQHNLLVPSVAMHRHRIKRLSPTRRQGPASDAIVNYRRGVEFRWDKYLDLTKRFNRTSMPTVYQVAQAIAQSGDFDSSNQYEMARALERHFLLGRQFSYSLTLNAQSIVGMDPIEQFLAVDQVGHCQYFASALAMMLRSQGIPSRLVVGYKTHEYDPLGSRFVARQSHAHAWVEALIDREFLEDQKPIATQPWSQRYWLRLDPTPAASQQVVDASSADKVMDLAQNFWEGMVIDMDGEKQPSAISGGSHSNDLQQSYRRMLRTFTSALRGLESQPLAQRNLSGQNSLSGSLLLLLMTAGATLVVLIWVLARRKRLQRQAIVRENVFRPRVEFYAAALDQLARMGICRQASETPLEFQRRLAVTPGLPGLGRLTGPLRVLTSTFYAVRYQRDQQPCDRAATQAALDELRGGVDRLLREKQTETSPPRRHA